MTPGKELLGQYVVDKVVGSGGYGLVWKAVDKQLGRNVAIKRLLRHHATADQVALKALIEEAKKNALVVHSNVAQVYAIIEVEGEYLIVMEFVDGGSLHEHLRHLALAGQVTPLDQGADWLIQILEGVAFAHRQGVCHRDLSPMNILLTSGGVPKVTDFGTARLVAPKDAAVVTPTSSKHGGTGNPEYMAPEQARGESADFLSDLFMVGICGYMLLTGRHPFAHPSGLFSIFELLKDESYLPPTPTPPPSMAISDQRRFREYAAIVMRLLSSERASRYQNAQEAIDAMESVVPSVDCPSCGEHIPDQYKFCGHCGSTLAAPPVPVAPTKSSAAFVSLSAGELADEGYRLVQNKLWSQALSSYTKALEVDPKYPKVYWNIGFVYNRIGKPEEAIAILNKGLALPPGPMDYREGMLYQRSVALASLKRYEEALSDINEAVHGTSTSARFIYFRARVHLLSGDLESAIADAKAVLKLAPDHSAALRLIDQASKGRSDA
jgi:serine/threonine-protein kinase